MVKIHYNWYTGYTQRATGGLFLGKLGRSALAHISGGKVVLPLFALAMPGTVPGLLENLNTHSFSLLNLLTKSVFQRQCKMVAWLNYLLKLMGPKFTWIYCSSYFVTD